VAGVIVLILVACGAFVFSRGATSSVEQRPAPIASAGIR
jgi:hypothetical protein